ncbi:MAG: hypothetical protein H6839_02635 [Planctomycetes bacterium]|nr:hypothetical protein [Planctomycetota bacterium]
MMGNNYESFHPECLEDEAQLLFDLGYCILPTGEGKLSVETPNGTEALSELEFAVGHAKEQLFDDLLHDRVPREVKERASFWPALDGLFGEDTEYQRYRHALRNMEYEKEVLDDMSLRAKPGTMREQLEDALGWYIEG